MTSVRLWRLLTAASLALSLGAVACSGDDNGAASPTASPSFTASSPSPSLAPTPATTFEPLRTLTFDERVTFYGAEAGDQASGLAAGDFNGDGAIDVALSAAFAEGPDNAAPDAGEVYLFFGPFQPGESRDAAAGGQDVTLFGREAGAQTGRGLAAGDVTGDGLDDLLIGAPFADAPGRADAGIVYVEQGRAEWPETVDLAAEPVRLLGADTDDLTGFSLATGDTTGDGVADVVVSAFWGDGPGETRTDAGDVYVLPGGAALTAELDLRSPPPGTYTAFGAAPGAQLGETVGMGFVNDDGLADVIIAATFGDGPGGSPDRVGNVYVLAGRVSDTEGDPGGGVFDTRKAQPWITGRDEGDQLGHSIASGDFDGDGFGDFVLGAVSADGPENGRDLAGEAVIVPGMAAAPRTPLLADEADVTVFYGGGNGSRIGRSLAAGDLDADGRADVVFAAPGNDDNGENSGSLLVVLGRSALPRSIDFGTVEADAAILGLEAGDALGTSTSAKPSVLVRDMDGDGRGDVLAGSVGGDGPANDRPLAGEAYVFFSSPLP